MKQTEFIETYDGSAIPITAKAAGNPFASQFAKETIKGKERVDGVESLGRQKEMRERLKHIEVPTVEDFQLKSSRVRRIENQKLKEEIERSQQLRESIKFLGKRERILKHAWKRTVMGFQVPQGK